MRMKRWICAMLLMALALGAASAQAAKIERAWMEYEDYSGQRAEQEIEGAKKLEKLEKILTRASKNKAKLDGCTLNCTLFCMLDNGNIVDFACATDGCPYIQNRDTDVVYTLGVDYQNFWEMFPDIKEGMGFEASSVFNW